MGAWGIVLCLPTQFTAPRAHAFFYKIMVNNINNFGIINFYENYNSNAKKEQANVEDITPLSSSDTDIPKSIIFTKKAQKENKIPTIIEALQNSVQGRRDKTRAFVDELHLWQKEQYIDAHYNAQVMYDELQKIIPLPFGYEVFKKHYNNTRY